VESPTPKRKSGCFSFLLALATFGLFGWALLILVMVGVSAYTHPFTVAINKHAHQGLTRADVERHLAAPHHEWDLAPHSDRTGRWSPAWPGQYPATSAAEYSCPDCPYSCYVIVHYNERNIVERAHVITFD